MRKNLVGYGTTRYSFSREKVEFIATTLKQNKFTVSSCYHIMKECSEHACHDINRDLEFIEKIIPLAQAFPVEKVWDAMILSTTYDKIHIGEPKSH